MKSDEIKAMLQRQAAWQLRLADLSWAEKIRMAESVRESVLLIRQRVEPGEVVRQPGREAPTGPTDSEPPGARGPR